MGYPSLQHIRIWNGYNMNNYECIVTSLLGALLFFTIVNTCQLSELYDINNNAWETKWYLKRFWYERD